MIDIMLLMFVQLYNVGLFDWVLLVVFVFGGEVLGVVMWWMIQQNCVCMVMMVFNCYGFIEIMVEVVVVVVVEYV